MTNTWKQLGGDIDGESPDDNSGTSVALSSNGSILAIGAPRNDGNSGSNRGHVRVYRRDPSNTTIAPIGWTQIGGDIDGENASDRSGESVALSADGSIVAIGATFNDGTTGNVNDNRGHVRVYMQNPANTSIAPIGWTQIGKDIDGEASGDRSGQSVALSTNGAILAIGARQNDDSGNNSGHVRVYKRNSMATLGWKQIGNDIDGEADDDFSGTSVSLSADGSIVAIGATNNDGGGNNAGHVRVYMQDPSNMTTPMGWAQVGMDIDGEASSDFSGISVSLSGDGSIVAIGAISNDGGGNSRGHVRVYMRNSMVALGWKQIGMDIDGEANFDEFGLSVSLSADGLTVAIGAPCNDDNGNSSGHIRVYMQDSTTSLGWKQIGMDIDGEAAGDFSGIAVALSANGCIVAIGATNNDGTTGSNRGHVRVFASPILIKQVKIIDFWSAVL